MLIKIGEATYVNSTQVVSVVKMRSRTGGWCYHVHMTSGVCYPLEISPMAMLPIADGSISTIVESLEDHNPCFKLLRKLWIEQTKAKNKGQ